MPNGAVETRTISVIWPARVRGVTERKFGWSYGNCGCETYTTFTGDTRVNVL